MLGGPVVSANDIDTFAEMKATRDVLEHAGGIANAMYRQKAGRIARAGVGDPLDISDDYHTAAFELVRRLINDLSNAAVAAA